MTKVIPFNDLARHNEAFINDLKMAVGRVIDSGWFVLGEEGKAFESSFAEYCGAARCVGVGNGTDALELALRALECGPGDDVLTVANAGMYSAAAITATGARPVFIDVDPVRLTMDPRSLAAARTTRTKAVIVTHLYGRLADMDALLAAADGAPVIEDCAQAHGAIRHGRKAGTFGALGCFSFFPTKNLGALGDGGAVVTNDGALAERVEQLRQYGWSRKYQADLFGGRNSRLDEMQAAVLRLKLPSLDGWNSRRRAIAQRYQQALPPGAMPPLGEDDVAHLAVVQVDDRSRLQDMLTQANIIWSVHYPIADHRQQAMAHLAPFASLPVIEAAQDRILTLPCFPEMTDREVERVVAVLTEFCNS